MASKRKRHDKILVWPMVFLGVHNAYGEDVGGGYSRLTCMSGAYIVDRPSCSKDFEGIQVKAPAGKMFDQTLKDKNCSTKH